MFPFSVRTLSYQWGQIDRFCVHASKSGMLTDNFQLEQAHFVDQRCSQEYFSKVAANGPQIGACMRTGWNWLWFE